VELGVRREGFQLLTSDPCSVGGLRSVAGCRDIEEAWDAGIFLAWIYAYHCPRRYGRVLRCR
jgi:hypothetical protein